MKEKENEIAKVEKPDIELKKKLESATKDLLYISETDAPLTPFFWPDESKALSPQRVIEHAKLTADAPVSTQTLNEFFDAVTTEEDWMNADEKAEVKRFQNLQNTLEENLKNINVFRFGETKIDVFVVGQVEGGFAGVQTQVVET